MRKNNEIKITTLLGQGSEFLGDVTAQGSIRVDAKVAGNVSATGTLIVGAAGSIDGNIEANAVLIGGEVLGNIVATEKAELTATAKVLGDITTKVIVIDEKAIFQGKCDMNQEMPERRGKVSAKAVRAGKKSAKAALAEALKEVEAANDEENKAVESEATNSTTTF